MAMTAAQHGQVSILRHFLSAGVPMKRSLATAAVKSGSLPVLKVMLDASMDVNNDLGYMGNPLLFATQLQRPDAEAYISYLLAHGADTNAAMMGDRWPGITVAALCGSVEVVWMYLAHGARVERTWALQDTARIGRLEVVKILIEEGKAAVNDLVDPELIDDPDRERGVGTALHAAATEGHVEVLKYLLEKGADTGVRDSNGRTVKEVAEKEGRKEVAEMLQRWEEGREQKRS